jgi:hypothetical protein
MVGLFNFFPNTGRSRDTAGRFTAPRDAARMLEIAERYEYLAQRAEERRRGSGS